MTLDTSLLTTPEILESLIPYVDLFMVSLKHFDSPTHKCLTGVPNEPILKNIELLSKKLGAKGKNKLWFRYMILPGYTDTWSNVRALRKFLPKMNFGKIELLPYHTYGTYKWKKLGLKYALDGVKIPSSRSVLKIKKKLEKDGHEVLVNV